MTDFVIGIVAGIVGVVEIVIAAGDDYGWWKAIAKWHAKNKRYNALLAKFKADNVTANEIANPTVYFAWDY